MRRHAFRNRGDLFSQPLPFGQRNGGFPHVSPFFAEKGRPVDRVLALEVGQHRVHRVLSGVHGRTEGLGHFVTQGVRHPLRSQAVGVELSGAGVLGDLLVHQRLGQARGVLFVVSQLAEADDVHHHVLAEFHPVLKRQLGRQHDGLRI
jgi:hypothetical protein